MTLKKRNFVNEIQTKEMRCLKYEMAKRKFGNRDLAHKISSWGNNHFCQFMHTNELLVNRIE